MGDYQDSGRREENIQDTVARLTAERDAADHGLIAWEARAMQAEAERDALKRWQAAVVPYLMDFAQVRTITGQMQPHWDDAKRLLAEAEGTET